MAEAAESVPTSVTSFVDQADPSRVSAVTNDLKLFVSSHASRHRPIVLVSSGGTAADLEVNCVRSLENFSTGLRGAIAVEEFLKRGYAVVHLWRQGSASPFARLLSEHIGVEQANFAPSITSLEKLFVKGDHDNNTDDDDDLLEAVLSQQDDFMSEPVNEIEKSKENTRKTDDLRLRASIAHSDALKSAMDSIRSVRNENRLLTVTFRTVEEYLCNLELCCRSLQNSHALALLFLAAAVSDYYIPKQLKSKEKLQSGQTMLNLTLYPVPKMLSSIKSSWCPKAMLVSFKLETDEQLLREKAERAMQKYNSDMVVGNELHTRYKKIYITQRSFKTSEGGDDSSAPYERIELKKPAGSVSKTVLEEMLVDHVVQAHFEFISNNFLADNSGVLAVKQAQIQLKEQEQALRKQRILKQVQQVAVQLLATAAAAWLSQRISAAIQSKSRTY